MKTCDIKRLLCWFITLGLIVFSKPLCPQRQVGFGQETAEAAGVPELAFQQVSLGGAVRPDPRWALLVANATALKGVLAGHYGFPEDHILTANAEREQVIEQLKTLAGRVRPGDFVLVSSCGHTKPGCFILDVRLSDVERWLKKMGGFIFVLQSTCHSGQAISKLRSAEIVYAGCGPQESEGGVFFILFAEALGNPAKADANRDGKVSLGEAFDYASRKDLIKEGYAKLHKSDPAFWPHENGPLPVRKKRHIEYEVWLGLPWRLGASGHRPVTGGVGTTPG